MNRILVTGATGFIGRNCLPVLMARGNYEIHAVSSRLITENQSNIQWHQTDLLDPLQVAKVMAEVQPSHLLHFAWYAVPNEYCSSIENLRWVQASLGLILEFAKHGGQRVVVAGTCAEYDWRYGCCSEEITPLVPQTLYGSCKHALQSMLDVFSRQTKLSSAWGRIFFPYGPSEHPDRLVSMVISSLLQDKPARCTHGNQIRDFMYAEDIASAFVAILQSEVEGPVNVASGHPITLRDLVCRIGERLGRLDLIRLGEVVAPQTDPPLLVADVRRLREEVDFSPKYTIETGLDRTVQWWKDHLRIVTRHG